jgi:hypothetical protein
MIKKNLPTNIQYFYRLIKILSTNIQYFYQLIILRDENLELNTLVYSLNKKGDHLSYPTPTSIFLFIITREFFLFH